MVNNGISPSNWRKVWVFFLNTGEFFGVFVVYYGHTEIVIFISSTSWEL